MDSLSISNYRNFEQQTLMQNDIYTKEHLYKKSFNFMCFDKHFEEQILDKTGMTEKNITKEAQKLNYLA